MFIIDFEQMCARNYFKISLQQLTAPLNFCVLDRAHIN